MASDIEEAVAGQEDERPIKDEDLLSIGFTLGNLAVSGRAAGAIPKGKYVILIGDTDSGKTWITMSALAEATLTKSFEGYQLIFDSAEDGALMDIPKYFGEVLAEQLQPPAGTKEEPIYSASVEEFYYNLDNALNRGPCIYVLDSIDALSSAEDEKKFQEHKKHHEKNQDKEEDDDDDEETGKDKNPKGDYGASIAKKNSRFVRRLPKKLRETGSILIIVNQTRDNIGSMHGGKTRSGGRALMFFATIQMWTSIRGKDPNITRTVKDKERKIGTYIIFDVKRSRLTGKKRWVTVPIYDSVGIDDLGACVDWLVYEKHWSKSKGSINAPEFDFTGSKEALIKLIQDKGKEAKLRKIVGRHWQQIEDALVLDRKSRYN